MLKIEAERDGSAIVLKLIGRIRIEHIETLESHMSVVGPVVELNLREITLVDKTAVRFLLNCESKGIKLVHCSPYIREWITREGQV